MASQTQASFVSFIRARFIFWTLDSEKQNKCALLSTAILCPTLDVLLGEHIAYSKESFEIDTIATYSCDIGFTLIGNNTRFCVDDDRMDTIGIWSGNSPSCERKLHSKHNNLK